MLSPRVSTKELECFEVLSYRRAMISSKKALQDHNEIMCGVTFFSI